MKNNINKFIAYLIWITISYLILSFCNLELNPLNWNTISRFLFATWILFTSIFYMNNK